MADFKVGAIGSERTDGVKNPLDRYKKYLPLKSGGPKLSATWFADYLKNPQQTSALGPASNATGTASAAN